MKPPLRTRVARAAAGAASLGALCALGASPSTAQTTFTLQQAVARGQQAGFQSRAAVGTRGAARAREQVFNAQYLPSLSIGGTAPAYTRSITPVTQPDGSTLYRPLQETDASLIASITQRIPWTNSTLSFSSGLSQVQVSGAAGFRTWSSTPFTFGITQPILRANTQRWDVREQDLRFESAERKYLEAREDVALAVATAFFDLHSAALTLKNSATNAATNDTLYTLNTGRYEVGKIGENDLLQSELALLRSRASLEDAKLAYERALSQFRITLNLAPGAPVAITVTAQVPSFDADTAVAVEQARRNVSAMNDAEASEVHARRSVSEARWNTGPGGNVSASYGYNATAGTASEAYKNLLDAQRLTFAVQMPVWQWGAHTGSVAAAKADEDAARATAQSSRAQVEQGARFGALQLAQARRSLVIAAKADTVAAKRFEVAYNRYVIGRITIDNLYIAQNEKDQALSAYVAALRGYWNAYYQLRKATLYDFEAGRPIR